ncbi:hypothetical protein KDW_33020 [Dictyobacter vulcani]|uniref:Clp ATPase C-terminal domain-containing protein n=1 Tax=Dictyobacter vulcani TaxID=2607529 RepID=A0A5J4KRV7_9CHLR|nr:hypothetical protein [Dictyobacter vulcani]GER89140.1 hypothetical protein KDW_33020 [Dictyobacter vulcani]
MKGKVLGELKNTFKPEFLNRIDEVVVFHSLRMEEMYSIVDLLLNRVRAQLTEQQIELVVPQNAKDFLIDKALTRSMVPVHCAAPSSVWLRIRWRRLAARQVPSW